jgi:deoxyribonuclease-4
MGSGEGAGIKRIVEALNRAHAETEDCDLTTVLETHAGQGTTIGHRFEHLRDILAGLASVSRAAVCFDTCHVFAAGYPIHTEEGWNETLEKFDRTIGLERLVCFHVNDSRKGLGCRVDRHAGLGAGEMGLLPFSLLVTDPRTRHRPMLLETPKGDDLAEDVENLAILRRLARGRRRAPRPARPGVRQRGVGPDRRP